MVSSVRPRRGPARALFRLLATARQTNQRILVLGVGNELCGDDAIGSLIASDLTGLGDDRFESIPVGLAVENAAHLPVRRCADLVVLIDAAMTPSGRLRSWALLPVDQLDSFCHTTHSIPLSLLVRYWQHERPGLETCFIGVGIQHDDFAAAPSPGVTAARQEIVAVFKAALGRKAPSRPLKK